MIEAGLEDWHRGRKEDRRHKEYRGCRELSKQQTQKLETPLERTLSRKKGLLQGEPH